MKALLYTRPYTFEFTDVPEPLVGDEDILVRVKACGICGSDVAGHTGKTGRRLPPLIMGHEAAGIVERVGRNVVGFSPGDRICFDSTVYCNQCPACREGLFNRCVKRQVLGVSVPDFKRDGAFAEFLAVPYWICAKLPDNVSFVQASLLEPASIGTHAASRTPISKTDTVVVVGAGTIGLFILQAAKIRGAGTVIASDPNEFRLGLAKKVGADICLNPGKVDLKEAVLERTEGRGADVVFEAVGFAETFGQAVAVTRTGGHVVAVGNLQKEIEINLQELVSRELTFTGSYASSGEFGTCIDLIASGRIDVGPLVSEVLPLSEGASAFKRLLEAKENLLKIVLEP